MPKLLHFKRQKNGTFMVASNPSHKLKCLCNFDIKQDRFDDEQKAQQQPHYLKGTTAAMPCMHAFWLGLSDYKNWTRIIKINSKRCATKCRVEASCSIHTLILSLVTLLSISIAVTVYECADGLTITTAMALNVHGVFYKSTCTRLGYNTNAKQALR